MRTLIAETVALKPHLETAGELALRAKSAGEQVSFAWLGSHLPWSDWELPRIARLAGCSLKPRLARFEHLLRDRGVEILRVANLDATTERTLREWAYAFDGDLQALKNYRYQDALLGMGAASSLISWARNSHYNPLADLDRVRACLYTAGIVYMRSQRLLESECPDRLMTFNGRFVTSKPIFEAARVRGIPVIRHERGAMFDRYECFEDAIHNYDYIRHRIANAWDMAEPASRNRLGHEFYKRRREGDGIYWYSFTSHMQPGLVPPRMGGKRRVVYFSSSDDEYAAVTDVYVPGPWESQLAAVQALIAECDALGDIELIVRIHPHMRAKSPAEQSRWKALRGNNLHIIHAGDPVDSYALIDSADVIVSYGSTIGIEAAYWGKPSILIGPCSYAGSRAVYEPKNSASLREMLTPHAVRPVTQEWCLPYGHYNLTFGITFQYYHPASLSEGTFLGERLGWDPDWVYWLRKQGAGKLLRKIMRRK